VLARPPARYRARKSRRARLLIPDLTACYRILPVNNDTPGA
jgi:hypothetical protein